MKKIFALVALSLISCDDGDLTVEEISFDDVNAQRCAASNVVYKLNDTEALILEIGSDIDFTAAFLNEPTPAGTPRTYPISPSNRVLYRSYNGEVAADNICGTIPPANPSVTEEWNATSGVIEITTNTVKSPNTNLPGGERITAYRHNITLKNVTFEKPSGTQVYQTFNFGDYNATVTPPAFAMNPAQLQQCPASSTLFNYAGSEAFTLDIDASLIVNEVTPLGSPRVGLLSGTTNRLEFTQFVAGGLTPDHFCSDPAPATPAQLALWVGADGEQGVSGIVEVTTTTSGGFLHEVRLKNVTLVRGNASFKLADDYLLGTFITN